MISLAQITQDRELVDDLAWPFDFSIPEADDDESWVRLDPEQPFRIIAGEGAGGSYIACGICDLETRAICYASSEGQFGKIGANLAECIAILVAICYASSEGQFGNLLCRSCQTAPQMKHSKLPAFRDRR